MTERWQRRYEVPARTTRSSTLMTIRSSTCRAISDGFCGAECELGTLAGVEARVADRFVPVVEVTVVDSVDSAEAFGDIITCEFDVVPGPVPSAWWARTKPSISAITASR